MRRDEMRRRANRGKRELRGFSRARRERACLLMRPIPGTKTRRKADSGEMRYGGGQTGGNENGGAPDVRLQPPRNYHRFKRTAARATQPARLKRRPLRHRDNTILSSVKLPKAALEVCNTRFQRRSRSVSVRALGKGSVATIPCLSEVHPGPGPAA